jgi:hypothetical protein
MKIEKDLMPFKGAKFRSVWEYIVSNATAAQQHFTVVES